MMQKPLPQLSSFSLPWPTDWQQIFGNQKALILDIGFGYGHTLVHLHKTRPDHNIIGLEIDNLSLKKAEKSIPHKGMYNVRVVRSRAETALHHLLEPQSLSEIHINFPDPWFKARHVGRRLIQRDTVDAMVNRMVTGAILYLATDIFDYAEMSSQVLESTPQLTNQFDTPWVHEMAGRATTKYEKKAKQVGRTCYYFAYKRNDLPAPHIPIVKEIDYMPHMVISTPLSLQDMMEQVVLDTTFAHDAIRVKFMNTYRNDRVVLFEVYVHEETIEQRVAIVVVGRDTKDEFVIKMSLLGTPRSTEGIHFAVKTLGKLLTELHPDAKIVQDTTKS